MPDVSRFAATLGDNAYSGTNNFQNSITGMFGDGAGDKAILFIYLEDLSDTEGNHQTLEDEADELNSLQSSLLSSCKDKLGIKEIGDDIKSAFTKGGKSSDKVGEIASENGKFVKFKVQYNPATIRLYSVNGKIQSRKGEEGIDSLKMYHFTGKSKLSFDLIFDNCDNMNAFGMNEIANMNFTSAANKGINAFKQGKSEYSVRKRMDAILSLLSSVATQQVVFYWAKMCFRGMITDVGNKFTMFNPQGNPIRGEMHIELTQDKSNANLKYDEQYWETAFKAVFKEKSGLPDDIDGSNRGQKWNNMLANNNLFNISL